jgi:hypothetical protein
VFMKIHSGEKSIKFLCDIYDLGTYISVREIGLEDLQICSVLVSECFRELHFFFRELRNFCAIELRSC